MIDRLRQWVFGTTIEFDPAWDDLLTADYAHWSTVDGEAKERWKHLTARFVQLTKFEAARDFEVTEEIKVLIAAQATLLLLGVEVDDYPKLRSVLVHGRAVRRRGASYSGNGIWQDGTRHLSGQAGHDGSIVLVWPTVRREARNPQYGHNVVYHEFAHRLDMTDGVTDGTPPLGDETWERRWAAVSLDAFARVQSGESVLRSYAGTNAAEFFAVATEMFFTRPHDLHEHEPHLARELEWFYGQDPRSRLEPVT